MIKQLRKVVELTIPEQRVVVFALCGLVGFVALKARRDAASNSRVDTPPAARVDQPSPSPGIRP